MKQQKSLKDIIEDFPCVITDAQGKEFIDEQEKQEALATIVASITNDSRKVEKGSLFFCIEGMNTDGHIYGTRAVERGASVLVVQKDISELLAGINCILVHVENTRLAMAFFASAFYDHPTNEIKTIGVTGTKGKTTTTYMIRDILTRGGHNVGLIGTIECWYRDIHIPADNTTPESIVLQKYFREMADAGVDTAVMEVSSQALMLHRTQGFIFDVGIFTNLSSDHISPIEHKNFEEYLACKNLLFKQCKVGVVNIDDDYTQQILEGHTCDVKSFGLSPDGDLWAEGLALVEEPGQLGVAFSTKGDAEMDVHVPMPGKFNAYNALAALQACRIFDVDAAAMQEALQNCKVKGRVEVVDTQKDHTVLIDYAHNALSLESVLNTLREYNPNRLICLFGCGGNRARDRRFEMGEISGRLADLTIITSDNPRHEDPLAIIADIRTGIQKTDGEFLEIPDRREAIRQVLDMAEPRDIVILAGKGHEDYQEIEGKKYPMDERIIIQEIVNAK